MSFLALLPGTEEEEEEGPKSNTRQQNIRGLQVPQGNKLT
jgi:hypothetical protein